MAHDDPLRGGELSAEDADFHASKIVPSWEAGERLAASHGENGVNGHGGKGKEERGVKK